MQWKVGLIVVLVTVTAATALARSTPILDAPAVTLPAGAAVQDTVYLLGGPGRYDGRFETAAGDSAWWGWRHEAAFGSQASHWHVSDYHVPTGGGTLAMWCGATFDDPCAEGYGNDWNDALMFTYAVPDTAVSTTLSLDCVFSSDSESGWDYFRIQKNRGGTWQDLAGPYSGVHADVTVSVPVTFVPTDYVDAGNGGNVGLQIRFLCTSDSNTSDEDCLYDSQGFAQIGEVTVAITGGPTFIDDFEDGTSHYWVPADANAQAIDLTHLERDLPQPDPVHENLSWQVCWRADPATLPPGFNLDNLVYSPPLEVPAAMDDLIYSFDVTRNVDANDLQVYYTWQVRSTAAADSTALSLATWRGDNFVYYGPPGYVHHDETITSLLQPSAHWLQVGFRVIDFGWAWGLGSVDYRDGTPYFDNVAVMAVSSVTDVPDAGALQVTVYPNPFNPRTTIALDLPGASSVSLRIYDLRGRLVRTLHDGALAAGRHAFVWDGTDAGGRDVAAGTYMYDARAAGARRLGKLALIR